MDKLKLHYSSRDVVPHSILSNDFELTAENLYRQRTATRTFQNDNFTVKVDGFGTYVSCNPTKLMRGNNVEQITLAELRDFKQILENQLLINVDAFNVTGFDFNQNLFTDYPPSAYVTLFRHLPKFRKLEFPTGHGVTFYNLCRTFSAYDKLMELLRTGQPVPLELQHLNVLRLELGFDRNVRNTKALANVRTFDDLTRVDTYAALVNEWRTYFQRVTKTDNRTNSNPLPPTMKPEQQAVVEYIRTYSLAAYFDRIEQWQRATNATPKQGRERKHKARKLWNEYLTSTGGTNLIDELNAKVNAQSQRVLDSLTCNHSAS